MHKKGGLGWFADLIRGGEGGGSLAKKRNGGVFKGGLIPQCVLCVRPVKKKETPGHYLLHFSKYEKERELLFKTIKESYKKKNSQYILTLTMEDVPGEQNFMHDGHKSLREAFEKYINSPKKDF